MDDSIIFAKSDFPPFPVCVLFEVFLSFKQMMKFRVLNMQYIDKKTKLSQIWFSGDKYQLM